MITKPTKYTAEFILEELTDMLGIVKANKRIVYKKQLFSDRDYTQQRFSEWANKFKDDIQISETIRKIDEIIESRNVEGAVHKEYSEKMTKFNLINNYGWKDSTTVDAVIKSSQYNLTPEEEDEVKKRLGIK